MVFQNGGVREAAEPEMPVGDFSLEALRRLVMEAHASFASAVEFEADESGVGDAIQDEHGSASGTIPDKPGIAAVADDEATDPPGAVRVFQRERSRDAIGARGEVEHGTVSQ